MLVFLLLFLLMLFYYYHMTTLWNLERQVFESDRRNENHRRAMMAMIGNGWGRRNNNHMTTSASLFENLYHSRQMQQQHEKQQLRQSLQNVDSSLLDGGSPRGANRAWGDVSSSSSRNDYYSTTSIVNGNHHYNVTTTAKKQQTGGREMIVVVVFLHIPKTGGTTIRKNLESRLDSYTRVMNDQNWTVMKTRIDRILQQPQQQEQPGVLPPPLPSHQEQEPQQWSAPSSLRQNMTTTRPTTTTRIPTAHWIQHQRQGQRGGDGSIVKDLPWGHNYSSHMNDNDSRYHDHGRRRRRQVHFFELHGDIAGLEEMHHDIQEWKQMAAATTTAVTTTTSHGQNQYHHESTPLRVVFWTFTLVREPGAMQMSYFRHLHRPTCHNPWCESKLYNQTQEGFRQSLQYNRLCHSLMRGQVENKKQQRQQWQHQQQQQSKTKNPVHAAARSVQVVQYQNNMNNNHNTQPVQFADCQRAKELLQSDWDWVGTTETLQQDTLPLLTEQLLGDRTLSREMKSYGRRTTSWGELHPSRWTTTTRNAVKKNSLLDEELFQWVQQTYKTKWK